MYRNEYLHSEALQAQLSQAEQQIAALQNMCQQLEDDKAALRQDMEAQQESSNIKISALAVELAELRAAAQAAEQQQHLHNASLQANCATLDAQLQHAQQQAYAAQHANQQLHQAHVLLLQKSAEAEEWSRQAVAQLGALQVQVQQLQHEVIDLTSCVDGLITVGCELLSDRDCRDSIRVALCFKPQDNSPAGIIRSSILEDLLGAGGAQGPSTAGSFSRPQHSAAPQLLLLQPRTPGHSQHLCDPPCSRSSSFEHLTLVRKGGEDAQQCDSSYSSHWAGGSC
jgi:hypothetical protein